MHATIALHGQTIQNMLCFSFWAIEVPNHQKLARMWHNNITTDSYVTTVLTKSLERYLQRLIT